MIKSSGGGRGEAIIMESVARLYTIGVSRFYVGLNRVCNTNTGKLRVGNLVKFLTFIIKLCTHHLFSLADEGPRTETSYFCCFVN